MNNRCLNVIPEIISRPLVSYFSSWHKVSAQKYRGLHVVRQSENLTMIAKKYHTSVADILWENIDLADPDVIYPGQIITIPNKEY